MEVNEDQQLFGYRYSLNYILFSAVERNSYKFGDNKNDDIIFIFGWNIPLILFKQLAWNSMPRLSAYPKMF